MSKTGKITVKDRDPVSSLQDFLKLLLEKGTVEAVLVQQWLPMKNTVMPALVTDPEKLDGADPLAPAFPLNGARMLSRLTRKPLDAPIAACDVALRNQGFRRTGKTQAGQRGKRRPDRPGLPWGLRQHGLYPGSPPQRSGPNRPLLSTATFFPEKGRPPKARSISPACKSCEHPVAAQRGYQYRPSGDRHRSKACSSLPIRKKERKVLDALGVHVEDEAQEGRGRRQLPALVSERAAFRDQMFESTWGCGLGCRKAHERPWQLR